jgi:hypothetical protein
VVNYRDYPPQDNTYVYKFHPFSSNINDVQYYLRTLTGESTPLLKAVCMPRSVPELNPRYSCGRR